MNKLELNILNARSRTEKAIRDAYDLGKADTIEEILSNTKTIVDEDGIIFEVVLVKDINKLLSQSEIDKSIHGKELDMPKLSDEEIDDLLKK